MSKELIRLVNCKMAFDDEIVLDDINLYFNDKEFLTDAGALEYLRGKEFRVERVDFAEKYFGVTELDFE